MDKFTLLLDEVGALLGLPLHLDHNRLCQLNINGELHIPLMEEVEQDRLLMLTHFAEIPPGKFKENVFKAALKENGSYPRIATLGFCETKNRLALFTHVSFLDLTGEKFVDALQAFIERALLWKKAVETGDLSTFDKPIIKKTPSIFDVQPPKRD